MSTVIRDAAATILWRRTKNDGYEVYLQKRTSGASFMANASVFPGGAKDSDDPSPRYTAIRELFEESGVLFCNSSPAKDVLESSRRRLLGGYPFAKILAENQWTPRTQALRQYSSWRTPSLEGAGKVNEEDREKDVPDDSKKKRKVRRFNALFFIAEMPPGQDPSVDNLEAVEHCWISPADALQGESGILLAPPQLLTMYQLATFPERFTANDPPDIMILPRFLSQSGNGAVMVFPWDKDYDRAKGEAHPWDGAPPPWPSRVLATKAGWELCGQ